MKQILLFISLAIFILSVKGQEVVYEYATNRSFLENKGQWPENVLFKNKVNGGNMWVEQKGILFQLQDYSQLEAAHGSIKTIEGELTYKEALIQLQFVGAQETDKIEKKGRTEHYYNYFIGNDESKWASDVRGYDEFTLKQIYSGINLRYIDDQDQVKYEFHVSPKSDPNQIRLQYAYQKKLKINREGDLVIQSELGNIIEKKPYAYQIVNGKIIEVPCNYIVNENIVTFKLGEYNKRVELIIDPTLVFATYSGANSDNFGMTATYGYDGTAYNGGTVYGNSFPMPDPNSYDPNSNMTIVNVNVVTTDAFISRYSADGTTMMWSTFFGGGDNTQGTDLPHSLICDRDNNIYVFGTTSSLDFPVVNGFQTTHGGGTPLSIQYNGVNFGITGSDMYVAKFSSNGHNLMGSTYVGGDQNDGVNYMVSGGSYSTPSAYDSLSTNYGDQFRGEIMLDSVNNIIVGSCTRSANFPVVNAFQNTIGGQEDGVILKIKKDFSSLIFSSFYGGTKQDAIYSAKVDSSNNIVFCGGTTSLDLNVSTGAYQNSYNGGEADGFIGKLSPDGTVLTHSTYIGTPNYDQTFFVEIDRLDNVFVLGQSNGGDFPVIDAGYSNPNSSQFIAKLNPDLNAIESSTVFGSGSPTFDISPSAFLVDICGNMYVSGWGGNVLQGAPPIGGMPITTDAFQSTPPNGYDFYLTVIDKGFNGLLYATYLGGNFAKEHVDGGTSRFDKNGVVYQCVCGGCGGHSDFPTTAGAWSNQNLSSNCNALLFKFDFNLIPNANFTVDYTVGCTPLEVKFTNYSSLSDGYMWDFGDGDLDSTTFEPIKIYSDPGTYEVMLTVTDSTCLITDTSYITIDVTQAIDLEAMADILLCEPVPMTLTADANGTASTFVWSTNSSFTDTLNAPLLDSIVIINNPVDGYYYVKASDGVCSAIDSVKVDFTSSDLTLSGTTKLCLGDETVITATNNNPLINFTNFDWSADSIIISGEGTPQVTVQPNANQYLYVTAVGDNGCTIKDSILILVSSIDDFAVQANVSDSIAPEGAQVTLSAKPDGYSYTWLPPDGVQHPNAQETKATVYDNTEFTVLVSDGICAKSAAVWVTTFPFTCSEPYIFVPNAFSPNGDNENDVLYVRSKIIGDMIFRIYDRWGENVYESTSMHEGWDGTFRNKELKPDVYDYYLEGHCINGQEFLIKGNITLIR